MYFDFFAKVLNETVVYRIAAIDFGTKRIGVALSDPLRIIANGIGYMDRTTCLKWLAEQHRNNHLEILVVGEPKRLHGTASEIESEIKLFIQEINKLLPSLKVDRINEQFSSKLAMQAMHLAGASKSQKKTKGLVDQISATILLQDYLSQQ